MLEKSDRKKPSLQRGARFKTLGRKTCTHFRHESVQEYSDWCAFPITLIKSPYNKDKDALTSDSETESLIF